MFQYFPSATTGGSMQIADFCPRAGQYANGDCTDANNKDAWSSPPRGTVAGSDSRCFHSSLLSKAYMVQSPDPTAYCYRRTCKANQLEIHVNDKTVFCPVSDKTTTKTLDNYWGYFVCPPYSGLDDIRCKPTCHSDNPDCLGIKGSAADLSGIDFGNAGDEVVVHGRHLR